MKSDLPILHHSSLQLAPVSAMSVEQVIKELTIRSQRDQSGDPNEARLVAAALHRLLQRLPMMEPKEMTRLYHFSETMDLCSEKPLDS